MDCRPKENCAAAEEKERGKKSDSVKGKASFKSPRDRSPVSLKIRWGPIFKDAVFRSAKNTPPLFFWGLPLLPITWGVGKALKPICVRRPFQDFRTLHQGSQ